VEDATPLASERARVLSQEWMGLSTDTTLAGATAGVERRIAVENDLYRAVFSTRGATLVSFILKEYHQFDQVTPVQLVDTTGAGALSLAFTTPASHNVDTRAFLFETSTLTSELQVGDVPTELAFETTVGQGRLRLIYSFTPDTYEVKLRIERERSDSYMTREGFELVWNGGLPYTESNHVQEAIKTAVFARSGGEVEGIDLQSDPYEEKNLSGQVDWIAVKNQYFAAVLMPGSPTAGAEIVGERTGAVDTQGHVKYFESRLQMPPAASGTDAFTLYLGPLEYYRINTYDLGLYDMVDYGWDIFEWMTRPIARFILIPMFNVLDDYIPSYGIIVFILAFFIKVVVSPLTRSSYRSMAQMREIQPELQAIREKYADNPQKQQEATMRLYKESGVNPLGGCLPMFLQYPVLIALWQFLPQSIEIRQQGFLWASDLSAPDVILQLPFRIPLYGDFVAGFCLLMGLSMIVQMRMQATPGVGGTQAKVMMYMMPILLFVIFNQWASGLNLYYLVFNILSAIQQQFINRSMEKEKATKMASGNGMASIPVGGTPKKKPAAKARRAGKGASRRAKP
jgi:YidC/Oxa1 family membrane protein insertase